MTTSVRWSLKWDFINITSIRKHIVETDIVNYVTCMHQSVIIRVVVRFLWHMIRHMIKTDRRYKGDCPCLQVSTYQCSLLW